MKVEFHEFNDSGFGFSLVAETTAETTALVRLGLNAKAELPSPDVNVYKDSPTTAWFRIPCRRNKTTVVRRVR